MLFERLVNASVCAVRHCQRAVRSMRSRTECMIYIIQCARQAAYFHSPVEFRTRT